MRAPLLLAALIVAPASLHAQREVAPTDYKQPTDRDIVIRGNEQPKSVACDNNSVYIEGEHNEVQVTGHCGLIRIQGNRNYLWVEHNTVVHVEGNDNLLFFKDTETRYSNRGNNNRYERARH
jgi:hypothetical protein